MIKFLNKKQILRAEFFNGLTLFIDTLFETYLGVLLLLGLEYFFQLGWLISFWPVIAYSVKNGPTNSALLYWFQTISLIIFQPIFHFFFGGNLLVWSVIHYYYHREEETPKSLDRQVNILWSSGHFFAGLTIIPFVFSCFSSLWVYPLIAVYPWISTNQIAANIKPLLTKKSY